MDVNLEFDSIIISVQMLIGLGIYLMGGYDMIVLYFLVLIWLNLFFINEKVT